MKKIVLALGVLVSISFCGELPDNLKEVAKEGINLAGYRCNKVDSAYKKWDDSIKVVCNDWTAMFIIKKYGGRWIIEVEK